MLPGWLDTGASRQSAAWMARRDPAARPHPGPDGIAGTRRQSSVQRR
jgi:hypothetical protein